MPRTAAALPAISADGKTWTIKIKPGIFFTDDPAFKGKPRELVADDYVYSLKRAWIPTCAAAASRSSPISSSACVPLVDAARKPGAKMNYDTPVEGLRALDRHTLQLKLQRAQLPDRRGACS